MDEAMVRHGCPPNNPLSSPQSNGEVLGYTGDLGFTLEKHCFREPTIETVLGSSKSPCC